MYFRIKLANTSREYDVCAAAAAELFTRHELKVKGQSLALDDVEDVERIRLRRGGLLPDCAHHGQGLGVCP